MTVGRGTPRDLDELLADYKRRLIALERRLPAPPRPEIGPAGKQVTDWNQAVNTGFYWSDANAANRPFNVSWVTGYTLRNAMAGFERIVQEVRVPQSDRMMLAYTRSASWTGPGGTLVWSAWRRNDGVLRGLSSIGCSWNPSFARYDITPGAKEFSVTGCFVAHYRAYRILFHWYTGDQNGGNFRLRQGSIDETANDYQYQVIYATGGALAATQGASTQGNFPAQSAAGYSGEIIVTDPMYTAGNQNQKKIRGHWAAYSSGGSGSAMTLNDTFLVNHDNFAYDGFTLSLSDLSAGKNGVGAGAAGFIQIVGIAQ